MNIDDSNQPEFRFFLHNLPQATAKKCLKEIAIFFGYDKEALAIEEKCCGVLPIQRMMLLRVLRLPNCKEEINNVIDCLVDCCNIKELTRHDDFEPGFEGMYYYVYNRNAIAVNAVA